MRVSGDVFTKTSFDARNVFLVLNCNSNSDVDCTLFGNPMRDHERWPVIYFMRFKWQIGTYWTLSTLEHICIMLSNNIYMRHNILKVQRTSPISISPQNAHRLLVSLASNNILLVHPNFNICNGVNRVTFLNTIHFCVVIG